MIPFQAAKISVQAICCFFKLLITGSDIDQALRLITTRELTTCGQNSLEAVEL
jgi:hypothetical protein